MKTKTMQIYWEDEKGQAHLIPCRVSRTWEFDGFTFATTRPRDRSGEENSREWVVREYTTGRLVGTISGKTRNEAEAIALRKLTAYKDRLAEVIGRYEKLNEGGRII